MLCLPKPAVRLVFLFVFFLLFSRRGPGENETQGGKVVQNRWSNDAVHSLEPTDGENPVGFPQVTSRGHEPGANELFYFSTGLIIIVNSLSNRIFITNGGGKLAQPGSTQVQAEWFLELYAVTRVLASMTAPANPASLMTTARVKILSNAVRNP